MIDNVGCIGVSRLFKSAPNKQILRVIINIVYYFISMLFYYLLLYYNKIVPSSMVSSEITANSWTHTFICMGYLKKLNSVSIVCHKLWPIMKYF